MVNTFGDKPVFKTLWKWGYSGMNIVDPGRSSPTQIGSATNWTFVDASSFGGLATKSDGTMWGW